MRKKQSPEEIERKTKIHKLLETRSITNIEDIQTLFNETIAKSPSFDHYT